MAPIQHMEMVLNTVRQKTNRVLLFYSAGKDSIVLLDLLAKKFDHVTCCFMYWVKDLQHITQYFEWSKAKYPNVSFIQLPHYGLAAIYKYGIYTKPNTNITRQTTLADLDEAARIKTGIDFTLYGWKQSDSLNRRLVLRTYDLEAINTKTRKAYPLSQWSKKDVLSYIAFNKLPQPISYGTGRSNGVTFQEDCLVEIDRSQIRFAPYNPRKKDPNVVAKLKRNFKKVGFLGGVVWNERSQNLVSGHKRTESLDLIHGYDGSKETDYKIKVEKVTLDDKQEKEQNIFMNAAGAQGEFDLDILRDMVPDLDHEAAGLDDYDLNIIGISAEESTDELTDEVADIQDLIKKKDAIIKTKKDFKDKLTKEWEGDPYFTVTFDDYKAKTEFMQRLGLDKDERFIKGEILGRKIEVVSKF